MTNMSGQPPRHEWMRMTEYVSAKGNRYFSGYCGGLRFIMMADQRAEPAKGGVMSWVLSVQPSPNGLRPAERRTMPLPEGDRAGDPEKGSLPRTAARNRSDSYSKEARAREVLSRLPSDDLSDPLPF